MSNNVKFVPATCPNCGGQLMISEKQEKAICSYCGNTFVLYKNPNQGGEKAEHYFNLAEAERNMWKYKEALDYYNKALELDSKNYLIWYGKASAFGWSHCDFDMYDIDALIEFPPIGEVFNYFKIANENAPREEKKKLEQNANIEMALMCSKYCEALVYRYKLLLRALEEKIPIAEINTISGYIEKKHKLFDIQIHLPLLTFRDFMNKIEEKQKIHKALQLFIEAMLLWKKPVISHYRVQGAFNQKYVPDRILTLPQRSQEEVDSFFPEFLRVLESLINIK